LARIKTLFTLLPDTRALLPEWERLVTASGVTGKNAHDARLVAAMIVHGVTHLLTFNVADFSRYSGIIVLNPASVVAPLSSRPHVRLWLHWCLHWFQRRALCLRESSDLQGGRGWWR
jgi:hypothetical protein